MTGDEPTTTEARNAGLIAPLPLNNATKNPANVRDFYFRAQVSL
jgi:hypothetical protein